MQKDIEIILLRQWASHLATPVWVAGEDGSLIYYNEPAETLLGTRFEEAGEMPLEQLSKIFEIREEDGQPLRPEAIPLGIALAERRPAHGRLRYRALDGVWRLIEVTAFPLEGQGGRHLGAVVIFWEVAES